MIIGLKPTYSFYLSMNIHISSHSYVIRSIYPCGILGTFVVKLKLQNANAMREYEMNGLMTIHLLQVERLSSNNVSANLGERCLELLFKLIVAYDLGSLCHLSY